MSPTEDALQISVLEIPSVSLCWHPVHETHKQISLPPLLCVQLLVVFPHLPWWVCSFIGDILAFTLHSLHTAHIVCVSAHFGHTSDLVHALSLLQYTHPLLRECNVQAIIHLCFFAVPISWLLCTLTTANWQSTCNISAIFSCILQILFLYLVLPSHADMSLYKSPLLVFCTFCSTYTCTVLLHTCMPCHVNIISLFFSTMPYAGCLLFMCWLNSILLHTYSLIIITTGWRKTDTS